MNSFIVKSCTLPAISLGKKAHSLLELRDQILIIPDGCLYMHFWGNRLFPRFTDPDYHNDFAIWSYEKIHDQFLAERLSVLDPMDYSDINGLRQTVVKTIEQRMGEIGPDFSKLKAAPFHFVNSKLLICETPFVISHPKELKTIIPKIAPSSIFYHFIDAKMRTAGKEDDFSAWLNDYHNGYQGFIKKIHSIDASFLSLREIKEEFMRVIIQYNKEII